MAQKNLAQKNKFSVSKAQPTILVGVITLVGLLIRFGFIAKSSIWHDEGFSIMLASRGWLEIWAPTARDVHPPLYYELLHLWMNFFGHSEVAIRSLSALAGVAIIPLGYLVAKKAAGRQAGYIAAGVLALAPFLIRYSQEARMYGILGLFLILALYCVMRIVQKPESFWPYAGYTLSIAAAMYTHYFAALAVVSFWLYLILLEPLKRWRVGRAVFLSWRWWVANIVAGLLFVPWLPSMLAQLKRGQGLSWLQPTSWRTVPDTVWQFFTFTDGRMLNLIYWLLALLVIAGLVWLWLSDRSKQKFTRLLIIYTSAPIAIGILVSLRRPIFHERYFAFAAIGFYILVAIAVDRLGRKNRVVLVTLIGVVCLIELVGIRNVYAQSSHQMRTEMAVVNSSYQPGDKLVSGELYTYFDGSYYNGTGQRMLLYTGNGTPNGYGESALLYDQNVYLPSYNNLPTGSRVWLVGKTGEHDYYDQIPSNWQLLRQSERGYSETRLYQIQ